jgi:nucleolar protein 15
MKKYFSQFGRVNKLRLSRNKKTGASKHYAFVEFQSQEVADIVARTMNNYLLFGHILKVHLIPTDQVQADLFKGANQRFKVDPRNKKAGLEMERGVGREQWAKRVENEKSRRTNKAKELKELFDYEFEGPELKSVDSVPKQTAAVEAAEPQQLLEAPAEEAPVVEQPKGKKGKKGAKAQVEAAPAEEATAEATEAIEAVEAAQPAPAKKGKKSAKAPVEVEPTSVVEPTETTSTAAVKKGKKGAKGKVVASDELNGVVEEAPAPEPTEPVADKKTKKDKKRKSDAATLEATAVTDETVSEEAAPKSKKTKKAKEVEVEPLVEDIKEKKRKAKSEETVAKPKKAKKAKA